MIVCILTYPCETGTVVRASLHFGDYAELVVDQLYSVDQIMPEIVQELRRKLIGATS